MKSTRIFLTLALALSLALTAFAARPTEAAPALQGAKLTLLIHPTLFAATGGDTGIVREFEQATGATVEVVTAPIGEHIEKALVEFIAGSGRYDVIAMQGVEMNSRFFQYLLPLDDYIARDGEDWDWADIIPSLSAIGAFEGQQFGIPFRWGTQMLYYRKDLLEQMGVSAPKTVEEIFTAAKALTRDTDGDGKTDIYGLVQRGKPIEIAHDWLGFFYGAGGTMLNEDMTACTLNTPVGAMVSDMMRNALADGHMPPDFFAIGRDDYITLMQQGRVAMGVYFSPYWGRLVSEQDSTVGPQMSWALPPTEPGVPEGRTRSGGWLLTIPKDSKNPDAAWELVKTLTSKENSLREAVEFSNGPVRISTYTNEAYLTLVPMAEDVLTSVANSLNDPRHPFMNQIMEVISNEITEIVRGNKGSEQGLADACVLIDEILAQTN